MLLDHLSPLCTLRELHIFFFPLEDALTKATHKRTIQWMGAVVQPIDSLHMKCYSLGAESRKKSYAKHFGYKLATGLHLKKNEF